MTERPTVRVTGHAAVTAVLAGPEFTVAQTPPADGGPGISWLRAQVPRFCDGATHRRRRAAVQHALAGVDPRRLRALAGERTRAVLAAGPVDLAGLAREVPVSVLAGALGAEGPVWREVAVVASGYFPGTDAGPAGDAAVAHLVRAFGGVPDERTAGLVGLLVQAADATAGLIVNAVRAAAGCPGHPVDALLAETLRFDPPVRVARRTCRAPVTVAGTVAGLPGPTGAAGTLEGPTGGGGTIDVPAGSAVILDLAAANRDPAVFTDPERFDPGRSDAGRHLTFGAGRRPCPGREHALALAAGVVGAAVPAGLR